AVPYYAYEGRFPSGLNAHGHALVLGEGVSVRQSPGSQRPVVAILTYGIVTVPKGWTGHRDQDGSSAVVWLQVGVGDGIVGHVPRPYRAQRPGNRQPHGAQPNYREPRGNIQDHVVGTNTV